MSYHFRPRKPPSQEIQQIAGEQITAALQAATRQDETEAIHTIRKHCKKMRALLRLVQKTDNHTEQRYQFENAHYRQIAELLSGSRDAVSLRDALAKQLGAERFPATAAQLNARIQQDDNNDALQQAGDLLAQGQQHIEQWQFEDLRNRDLQRGYARSYRRAYKAMQLALAGDDDTRMHTLRKRVKDQWYHTRLLHDLKPKKIGRRRARLKILASALGDWRDLRLLCAFLTTHKGALGAEAEKELIPLLDSARQRLEEHRNVIGRECDCLLAHKRWQRQRKGKIPASK